MFKSFKNEKGISMVGSLIMVTLLAYIGASVTDFTSSDTSSTTNELQTIQALQVGNGGLQEAKEKLTNGESPNVTDKSLGKGTYTTTTNPTTQVVTVVAQVGAAKKTQTLTATFSQQAMDIEVAGAAIKNKDLEDIEAAKSTNNKVILTQMKVEWNWSLCAKNLTCDASTSSGGSGSTGKTTICHYPPGNPSNAHTISVGNSAVATHVAQHGDTIGTCPGDPGSSTVVCEGYDAEVAACGDSTGGATVKSIKFNNSWIAQSVGATSGQLIDVTDTTVTANQSYMLDQITFSSNLPTGSWYKVTFYFQDGSVISKSFKFSS